jgi:hydrogenase maturation protease
MTAGVVVIGIGNSFRRDDGVGVAVAEEIVRRDVPGVRVVTATGEPGAMLDAWAGARLAVIVDAVAGDGTQPGRIRRCGVDEVAGSGELSSHAVGLPRTYELGRALNRLPDRLVVFTVDVADTRHGIGLSSGVAAAVPDVVAAVTAEAVDSIRGGAGSESPA